MEYDAETGLIYFGGRYYSPELGRWITPDPLFLEKEPGKITEMPKELNLYAYVQGNPMSMQDPNGELAFFWHGMIMAAAALNSGKDVLESAKIAVQSVLVDFETFNEGTQGTDPEATRQHGMAGEITEGTYQTREEAIVATKDYIVSSVVKGEIPEAAHAAQDLATPYHAGVEWRGFDWNWDSVKHIAGDIFPTAETLGDAYDNTLEVFKSSGAVDD